MKKKYSLLLIAFTLTTLKAQITFPAKGADWHYVISNGGFTGPTYYTNTEIKYTHDTLINGRTATVVNNSWLFTNYGFPGTNYFYTSNDSVFFYNAYTINQWQLLYSFNTPKGQNWQFNVKSIYGSTINNWVVEVDSVKKTFISGDSLKTLYVSRTLNGNSSPVFSKAVIIDRIGDIKYLLNIYDSGAESVCDGCSHLESLLCYQDSTLNLYQPDTSKSCNYTTSSIKQFINSTQVIIYPNPAQNSLQVRVNNKQISKIRITDVLGKEALQNTVYNVQQAVIDIGSLQNGIYFITTETNQATYTTRFVKQ